MQEFPDPKFPTSSEAKKLKRWMWVFIIMMLVTSLIGGMTTIYRHFNPSPLYQQAQRVAKDPMSLAFHAQVNGDDSWIPATSPLVLDLDGDGVEVTKMGYGVGASTTYFDLNNDGFAERTGWVTGGDGLLARDVNGNGKIDNQSELFGNNATYADGFANLASLDSNTSGTITSADAQWNTLRVWIDADGDAVTDAGELKTLTELGITSINLAATAQTTLYRNENFVSDTSTFVMNGQTRAIEDVWFRNDSRDTVELAGVDLNVTTLFLPTLKGFGSLSDLHVAMSRDSVLLELVQDFVATHTANPYANAATIEADVEQILFRWAGADSVSPTSKGTRVDAREMIFMHKLTGFEHPDSYYISTGGANQIAVINRVYQEVLDTLKSFLILQIGGQDIFESSAYNAMRGDFSAGALSQSGINDLVAQAISSGNVNAFWASVAEVIVQTRGPVLTIAEIGWLNSAITSSGSTTAWATFVANEMTRR